MRHAFMSVCRSLVGLLGMDTRFDHLWHALRKDAGLIELAYSQVDIVDLPALEEKVQFGNWLPTASR